MVDDTKRLVNFTPTNVAECMKNAFAGTYEDIAVDGTLSTWVEKPDRLITACIVNMGPHQKFKCTIEEVQP